MADYFRTPEMQHGGPFKCQNCGKKLATKIKGPSDITFKCPRCRAFIHIVMGEPVPWANKNKEGSDEHKSTGKQASG